MKRQERIDRILSVGREYLAATAAIGLLDERLRADPSYSAKKGWKPRDARNLRANLEATFLVRMFAEFEAGLRDAWRNAFGRDTQPPVGDLIAAIGSRRMAPQDWIDSVNAVREYRNALIHEEHAKAPRVPIAECRSRLSRFLSRLPEDW